MITLLVAYTLGTVLGALIWLAANWLPYYWQQRQAEKARLRRCYNDLNRHRPGRYIEEE